MPAETGLPLRAEGHRRSISCLLAGAKVEAVLSTGLWADLLVDERLAMEHGWLDGSEPDLSPGGAKAVFVRRPLELELGGERFLLEKIVAARQEPTSGMPSCALGMGVLSRLQLELDFKRGLLRLHPLRSAPPFPRTKSRLIFAHRPRGAPLLRACLRGRLGWLAWDALNEPMLFKDCFDAAFPEESGRLVFSEQGPMSPEGPRRVSQPMAISGLEASGIDFTDAGRRPVVPFEQATARIADLPALQEELAQSHGVPLLGFAGADLFGAERLLWDPGRGYLWRYAATSALLPT